MKSSGTQQRRQNVDAMRTNIGIRSSSIPMNILSMKKPTGIESYSECDLFDDATLSSVLPDSLFVAHELEEQMKSQYYMKTPPLGEPSFEFLHVNTMV